MVLRRYFSAGMIAAALSMMTVFSAFASPLAVQDNSYVWTQTKNDEWSCTDENGKPVKGWAARTDDEDEDKVDIYYLDKDGIMRTGWVKYGGDWYYLDEKTGILATDTTVDGDYAVDSEGKMVKIMNR